MSSRIYLDNAATSWPKPNSVYEAIDRYQRENGASAGRSTYGDAIAARQIVDRARWQLGQLLNVPRDGHVVFAFNGTDALNLGLHGLLQPGDHVVTSELEHNSVLRPLAFLTRQRGITVDYAPTDVDGTVTADAIRGLLTPTTRLVAMTHASNVTGGIQPLADIAEVTHQAGALLLVDGAQSVGHFAIDVTALGIDLLATSGHKGLLGPLGTGIVYVAPHVVPLLESVRQGGTGSQSDEEWQPETAPDKYESGNHNVPGLAGLEAGTQYVTDHLTEIRRHERELGAKLIEGLQGIRGIALAGPAGVDNRVGVVSFTSAVYDPQELAALLDASGGVQLRAGLHCAPRIHARLGTLKHGGTLRASIGPFNTSAEIEALLALLHEIHP